MLPLFRTIVKFCGTNRLYLVLPILSGYFNFQCFKETLRMYPPVTEVDREAPEDIEYNGYRIPKGTSMGVSSCLVILLVPYHLSLI